MPNHNHQQPLKELPCPPDASTQRAASLPSALSEISAFHFLTGDVSPEQGPTLFFNLQWVMG